MLNTVINAVFTCFAVIFIAIEPAHAYLDPGSGALVLQLLLSGVAGLLVVGKIFWSSLKAPFVRSELEIDVPVNSPNAEGGQSEQVSQSEAELSAGKPEAADKDAGAGDMPL